MYCSNVGFHKSDLSLSTFIPIMKRAFVRRDDRHGLAAYILQALQARQRNHFSSNALDILYISTQGHQQTQQPAIKLPKISLENTTSSYKSSWTLSEFICFILNSLFTLVYIAVIEELCIIIIKIS